MRRPLCFVDDGCPRSLEELPPGSFFRVGNDVVLKSEYHTDGGAVEAYIVGSGEMFWGDAQTAEAQCKLVVQPVRMAETKCALCNELATALEDLMAVQNGPPLIREADEWYAAIARAETVIAKARAHWGGSALQPSDPAQQGG